MALTPMTGQAERMLRKPTSHRYSGSKPTNWNKTMEELPAEKVFPEGRKMFLSGWNITIADMPIAADAGFSVAGVWGAGYKLNKNYYPHVPTSMHVLAYVRTMGPCPSAAGTHTYQCFNSTTEIQLKANAKKDMDDWLSDPNVGNRIYGWMYPLDDGAISLSSSGYAKLTRIFDYIHGYDTKKRTVGNNGGSEGYMSNKYHNVDKSHSNYLSQNYIRGGSSCNASTGLNTVRSNMYYLNVGWFYHGIDKHSQSPTGKPRLIPVETGPLCWHKDAVPAFAKNATQNIREFKHDHLLALMAGCNAIQVYQMARSSGCNNSSSFVSSSYTKMYAFVKKMSDNDVFQALLWGKGAHPFIGDRNSSGVVTERNYNSPHERPITAHHVSGDTTGSWRYMSAINNSTQLPGGLQYTTYKKYMLTMRDIQFNHRRYIILTNSLPQPETSAHFSAVATAGRSGVIVTQLRGFPSDTSRNQIYVENLLSGTIYTPTAEGKLNITIKPTDSVVLMIRPANGYVGSDDTSSNNKPIVANVSPTNPPIKALGQSVVFTAKVTGSDTKGWQYLNSAAGSVWTTLSAIANRFVFSGDTLTVSNINENDKDRKFRAWGRNSHGTSTGGAGLLRVNIPSSLVISKVKVGGIWKDMQNAYVKVSGAWKKITAVKIKVNGVWRVSSFGLHLVEPKITTQPKLNASYVEGSATPTLTVVTTPSGATVQWQWRNPTAGKNTYANISGKTSKSYKIIDRGAGLTLAQKDDRFRVVVKHDSITLNSAEVKLNVTAKPITETVKNGNFSSGTTNWTSSPTNGLSVSGGQLKITNKTATAHKARQVVTVVKGKKHKLSIKYIDSKWCNLSVRMGSASYSDNIGAIWATSYGTKTINFTPTTTKIYLDIRVGTNEKDRYIIVDDVSIKEV